MSIKDIYRNHNIFEKIRFPVRRWVNSETDGNSSNVDLYKNKSKSPHKQPSENIVKKRTIRRVLSPKRVERHQLTSIEGSECDSKPEVNPEVTILRNIPFCIITWLISTYISIITTAKFKIVDRFTGLAYQIYHFDIMIMFLTSQLCFYGLLRNKGKLTIPWLITMVWGLSTSEAPCLYEIGKHIFQTSFLAQAAFVGSLFAFLLKIFLWIEVLSFANVANIF